jgi:hypothetical protein
MPVVEAILEGGLRSYIFGKLALGNGNVLLRLRHRAEDEGRKWPSMKTDEFQVLWVQNRGSADDKFDSYVIFADGPHHVILTSHRNLQETYKDVSICIGSGTATVD